MTQPPALAADRDQSDRRTLRRVLALTLPLSLLVLVCLPNGPVFKVHSTASVSMEPTIPVGSYFIASRWPYGWSSKSFLSFRLPVSSRHPNWIPQRGDIATFITPNQPGVEYVKRIIALPGERVAIKNARLVLNSIEVPREPLAQPSTNVRPAKAYTEQLPAGEAYTIRKELADNDDLSNMAEVTVQAGHVFVLGDNRDNSVDSRFDVCGQVPIENLVGKVVWIFPAKLEKRK